MSKIIKCHRNFQVTPIIYSYSIKNFRMIIDEEPKAVKLHDWNIGPKVQNLSKDIESKIPETLKGKKHSNDVSWTVGDISKAGRLLSVPPLAVEFDDEQEMRRVYSLIYDVFRYKTVLAQALNDVTFFQIHPKLEQSVYHVWLLFYDLYHRNFKKRDTKNFAIASKLFDAVNLLYAENALWSQKIRLAAAVSRLRIKHCALSLHDLLPAHLKDKKVTEQANHSPLTCWVNSIKVNNFQEFTREIEKTFQLKLASETKKLEKNTFKIDKHCPQILIFHSSMRAKLAKSNFVKEHFLVVQDKSFCRGAATFGKVLLDLGLTGSVIQTHVNSPRTTAYLAILLNQNEKINKLIAFSAGKRKPEYEHYFTELGVTNIKIFSDRLIDSPQDAPYMEEVVAIFATPPNSYSAVTDPIDLVCSRGGDLSMLETLTESEQTKATQDRVIAILEEQRKTLRFAMSRPQIQFVVYETHSELDAENEGMVNRSIKDINRMAKLQHAALSGKTPIPEVFIEEEKSIENGHTGDNYYNSASSKVIFETREKMLEEIEVPDTDLFTSPSLPSLGTPEDAQINWKNEGCFLSLIQRKEVIRLDDKYMIQMAENRGLFGSSTTQNTLKSKTSKSSKKKRDKDDLKFRSRKKLKDNEIERIAAPTHTFLSHIKHNIQHCPRCQLERENMRFTTSQYKKWWSESARHVIDLKKYLVRHKLLPSQKITQLDQKQIASSLIGGNQSRKIDEIAMKYNGGSKFPIFPKLRLSRESKSVKIQVPVAVNTVEFPEICIFCNK
ncbi:hypothetical protein ABEB36_005292 [Hypothenemus hampei]|uniref:Uncharacterized protein n=1 Tax=Hypothenemus hampei TaxID=57062 RepID=A0ABD1EXU4_HYPHA